ncbi:T9SS type A sorting domain-containing protein [Reichenbachiella carrageenanivorans]|uniref:T9SS type A sorting domain-containing protein n=1 Tax=Reichenbachiella carrageenanivorans TaxID=2979869 RepID=A0ABY6D4T4_9BACT|nr:T9SS type A sorting domain-containing protein [Reichenbachiella carrageenanivorans]UXX80133.1 T9SS type A sorting domain-containing protein [Reichenbachiella carrageenanivorans]
MKALKLLVIAILTLTTAALANVNEVGKKESAEINAQIFSQSNDLIYVQLDNPADNKVKIVITDMDGVLLHNETIKKDLKVLKRFDVSNLPSGLYSYKVSSDSYTIVKKIEKK